MVFQARHFHRDCVSGSLNGWVETEDCVDSILGYQPESLTTVGDINDCLQSLTPLNTHGCDAAMGNYVEGSADINYPPCVPGCLPEKGTKVTPLRVKEIENVMKSVMGGYNSMSLPEQFDISQLVVQLQELVTFDHPRSTTQMTQSGMAVTVPQADSLRCQPKNRLLPMHEVQASKTLKKRKQLQYTGVVQVVHGNEHDIQMNPMKTPRTCQFCTKDHAFPACPRREALTMSSNEFLLSTISPLINESLRSRLKFSVPYSQSPTSGNVLSNIASHLLKANFIIHEAVQVNGIPENQIERRYARNSSCFHPVHHQV